MPPKILPNHLHTTWQKTSAFMESLSTANFYSFLMDGTTDAGNIEDEVIVFRKDDTASEVGSLL